MNGYEVVYRYSYGVRSDRYSNYIAAFLASLFRKNRVVQSVEIVPEDYDHAVNSPMGQQYHYAHSVAIWPVPRGDEG